MRYIIAYDIADPFRLRKVASICKDYGTRVEYSVFECELSSERLDTCLKKLEESIVRNRDAVIIYPVCGECDKKIRRMGTAKKPENKSLYIL